MQCMEEKLIPNLRPCFQSILRPDLNVNLSMVRSSLVSPKLVKYVYQNYGWNSLIIIRQAG